MPQPNPSVSNDMSQIEDFLNRASMANIETGESGSGESWEVMDGDKTKQIAQEGQDEVEWVLVGMTEKEKEKRVVETVEKNRLK
ncbi:hypothetical protein HBH56_228440 [Parastagonospora nodorum]|uniref:Uncharacterized protein n=2 Tax=Phaeosphaeria nodorum (strain SN15 / ATCC MYA-4574 / FGSC 10173) TaxID=321614 RepID=A0A7U2FED2_PHANO|nr:hypothetical protein SNOG_15975 [Parastagonospora nodorum SN15]KAH3904729.1 hypothetical protein HBH56_228440 [Parastagonospora nodorum]EAT76554.1 hypothetical protein SNOG_15975 [Parastagonospora nodorum SN15]KAH3921869.1 hypothetical protein HBH54_234320 [Parastagonospora nodorum]KAH3938557.1 hypothetical protein HBH53_250290 [Parastagonospora nodorum]KAH3991813.1 hypothetical protein HBI10_226710 [Parastagonospora nodorum]